MPTPLEEKLRWFAEELVSIVNYLLKHAPLLKSLSHPRVRGLCTETSKIYRFLHHLFEIIETTSNISNLLMLLLNKSIEDLLFRINDD